MKLNHINLTVTDVLAAEAFLVTYFGMHNQRAEGDNANMGFLFDDDGLVLSLMRFGRKEVQYPGFFNIGFIQESEAKVDEVYQRLKDDGVDVPPPQRSHAWTFYVRAPGGFMVEVLS